MTTSGNEDTAHGDVHDPAADVARHVDDVVHDVVVVGAGPAGIAAALTAARRGCHVLVIDKASFPRDKCCGDGLTTLALRELELLDFDPKRVATFHRVEAATLRAPGGRTVTAPLPTGRGWYAAVSPRRELDAALVGAARDAGIEVREGVALTGARDEAGCLALATSAGRLRARHVIAADGMWSPTRKALGATVEGYRGEWHAFRQYLVNVTGPAAEQLIVWFDDDLLPGYGWSFPLGDGRANVGFGVLRGQGGQSERRIQEMANTWKGYLDRPHVRAALGPAAVALGRHLAWPIPARIDAIAPGVGRTLFVGDAVAATDVLTGEGIGQALLTGRLAATAVADHLGEPPGALRAYRRAVEHELHADHAMSRRLSRLLSTRRGADTALAIIDRSGSWGRRNFARWMFEDEPRAIVVTPRRWHRHFLARRGAHFGGLD